MSESPLRPILRGLFFLLLLGGAWGLMDLMETSLEDRYDLYIRQRTSQFLPLLRERSTFGPLANERALNLLREIRDWQEPDRGKLIEGISRTFGPTTPFLFIDGGGNLLEHGGIPAPDVNDFRCLLRNRLYIDPRHPPPWKLDEGALSAFRLFNSSPFKLSSWNQVSFRQANHRGVDGLLVMGVIPRHPLRALFLPPRQFHASLTLSIRPPELVGGVLLFIPLTRLQNADWRSRALLGSSLEGDPRFAVFRPGESIAPLDVPSPIASWARTLGKDAFQGVFATDGWAGAFLRLPPLEDSLSPEFLIGYLPTSPPSRLARSGMGALWFLLLTGLLTAMAHHSTQPRRPWRGGLLLQFAGLAGLAVLIPAFSLLWVNRQSAQVERAMREITIFDRLAATLDTLETRHQFGVSQSLAAFKRFAERKEWLQSGPTPAMLASSLPILRNACIQYLFYQLGTEPARTLRTWGEDMGDEVARRTHLLMESVLNFVHRGVFRAKQVVSGPSAKEGMTADVIIEQMVTTTGPGYLNQLFLTQGVLQPFRAFHERAWIITRIIREADRNLKTLLMAVMERERFQEEETFAWVLRDFPRDASFPPVILLTTSQRSIEEGDILPVPGEYVPEIRHLLARCEREGAIPKMLLTIDGRVHACLGRKLRGMDLAALALEVLPQEDQPGGWGWLVIFYPFLIALMAGKLFHGFLLQPLRDLNDGVQAIGAGRFDLQLPILTDDEIGHLCGRFNHMAAELKEKEYLQRFLSDIVLDRVRSQESLTAGQTHGSILFADIRGFTRLTEVHSPAAVVDLLNRYLTTMEQVIEAEGGTIDKFIGDAFMAVFLPVHGLAGTAERAARAGLDLQRALISFNQRQAIGGGPIIEIGVGISTGDILMGLMGREDDRQEFVLTGQTVNRAAHMEKESKQGHSTRVVVCSTTLSQLGDDWIRTPLPATSEGLQPTEVDHL